MNETINFGDPIDFFYQSKTLYDLEKLNKISLNRGEVIAKPKKEGKYPVYSSSIHNDGLFAKIDNFMFDEELITWSIDGGGDFFYRSKHKFSVTNVSGYLRVLDKETIDTKYLYYLLSYLHSSKHFDYQTKAHPSVIRDLYVFNIPNIKIQKELSSLLFNLEGMLKHMKTQLNMTKVHKKSMLYKMFPKRESNLPEIRFSEFTEDWKNDKFSNLFFKLNNNTFSRKLLNYRGGFAKNIHYGDVLINYGSSVDITDSIVPFINSDVDLLSIKSDNYLKTGDVVFADTAEDTTAGKMVEIINKDGFPVLSGLHTYPCRTLIDFAEGYLGIYMNTSHFHDELIPYMQGSKVTGFNYEYLTRMIVKYPSVKEQNRIVDFFSNLDTLISNQEKEIITLERLKTTLLKKMFA
jgi:type I restriction enzyme S subunit